MNPFDLPPAGAPVSADPPGLNPDPSPSRPRRGRTALVAVLTLGLVGGGVAGVSQFASADRPDLATSAQDEPSDDSIAPVDDESSDESGEGSGDDAPTGDDREPTDDGQIVLDTGDGDPLVLDLGDLDIARIGELTECVGLPAFDTDGRLGEFTPDDWTSGEFPFDLEELFGELPFDLEALEDLEGDWSTESGDFGDLGDFGEFGDVGGFDLDGGSVTVVGPDGVSVIDLGENGSVTVTADDGELSVSTDGDATVSDLDDLFGELGSFFEPGMFGDEQLDRLPSFEAIDPEAIESCIDEVLGN